MNSAFYKEKGITSAVVESVLPSGGRSWHLVWYAHGVPLHESVSDYLKRKRNEGKNAAQ